MTPRNYEAEHRDLQSHSYAYGFDGVLRTYMLRAFERHLQPSGSTLELGCYVGDMTELLLAKLGRVTVVEASQELAERVGARFGDRITVRNDTFERVELAERFENVFLVHTLEHLDDPVAVLARCNRWLAPEGRLFLAVPNADALSRQLAVAMGLVAHHTAVTPDEFTHGHRRTYTLDVLLHHVREAGLRAVDSGGVLLKPLANFQFDKAIAAGIVGEGYLDACFAVGARYPQLCASVYVICAPSPSP